MAGTNRIQHSIDHLKGVLRGLSLLTTNRFCTVVACMAVMALSLPITVFSATFAVRISPPNFELKAKPGQVLRHVITLENADAEVGNYHVRTADWELNDNGGVVIRPPDQALPDNSCRPWTRIERRDLTLLPNGKKRYRFEVHVPEDAPDGECRFAVVFSQGTETSDAMEEGNIKVPIVGAIGVIVYVTVGNAAPDLEFKGAFIDRENESVLPVFRLHNKGNAHARPYGIIKIVDSYQKKAELQISPFPILSGQTTDIKLNLIKDLSGIETIDELTLPWQLKGLIEWEGGSYPVETTLE